MRPSVVDLGRMSGTITRRLLRAAHRCAAFGRNPEAAGAMTAQEMRHDAP